MVKLASAELLCAPKLLPGECRRTWRHASSAGRFKTAAEGHVAVLARKLKPGFLLFLLFCSTQSDLARSRFQNTHEREALEIFLVVFCPRAVRIPNRCKQTKKMNEKHTHLPFRTVFAPAAEEIITHRQRRKVQDKMALRSIVQPQTKEQDI